MLVHPYDHPDIIAGQGTAALELLQDVPDWCHCHATGRRGLLGLLHRGTWLEQVFACTARNLPAQTTRASPLQKVNEYHELET